MVKMCTRFIIYHNNDVEEMRQETSKDIMAWDDSLRNQQSRRVCAAVNRFFNALLVFIGGLSLQGNYV